ncbi:MAG: insulinase family protein [Tannerella sp.]|jgi:predicted Zn-dependent peptidase|nr:insulinase family protein [Tannerella sp.]
MRLLKLIFFTLLAALCSLAAAYGQGLKHFTLKNGLKVYIWEDANQSDVYGMVAVRTGSVNDPEQYTGLAHYLEHVLFKGTDKISALDWTAEEPVYKDIIAKYDQMADETDPAKKSALGKEINELTVKQSQLSVSTEFSNLMEGIGAKGLNAATSFDETYYINYFPAYQINKWLEISSQRFINPVFRTFQSELETVYEEYNRSNDNPNTALSNLLFEKAFEGSPYARPIIGKGEHLKNPRLSKLIQFYQDWYVPENMALILVGNIKTEEISARIASTFGRLTARPTPERKRYPETPFNGRKQFSKKTGSYSMVNLIYNGVKSGAPDEIPLAIATSLLSNGSSTGLLDKTVINGDLMSIGAFPLSMREQGRTIITAIPAFDENQRRFESNKSAEKKLIDAVQKVAKGEFSEELIEQIKLNMCRDFDLSTESNKGKADMIRDAFIADMDLNYLLNYKEEVMSVTIDRVKEVAAKYLNGNYIALHTEKGKPEKSEKIKKPKYAPLETPEGKQSLYALQFKNLPVKSSDAHIFDFSEVQSRKLNERSVLYYTPNPDNEVYSLTLRYGVGKRAMPRLAVAAALMNSAGIMGSLKSDELKEAFGAINTQCAISADDDYLYVSLYGFEASLKEACQLLSRQMLMPALDDKQLSQVKSSIIVGRMNRSDNTQTLTDALQKYVMYRDKSDYIDDLTDQEVLDLQIAGLTGDVNRAANYEAEIFYSGTLPFEDVFAILSQNLPLVAQEIPSDSPKQKEIARATENTVYFVPNSDVEQAQIYICMPLEEYDKDKEVLYEAFNQYFSGGFNGLVINELREKRSMVYSAGGYVMTPVTPHNPVYFYGAAATQNDKAVEALDIFINLLRDMPENEQRMANIKSYLKEYFNTSMPSFRNRATTMVYYQRMGFSDNPVKDFLAAIDKLTFDDILKFYRENIKDRPLTIGIMGNPKNISTEDLKKYGKVIRISDKKLFNDKDKLF